MTANNNKHIITNKIVWIIWRKQLLFLHVIFLSKASVIFNISSSHSDTDWHTRRFTQEKSLVSKYSIILHALLHAKSRVLWFNIKSFLHEPQSFIFLHSNRHLSWFHFYFELHTLSFNLHLHSHDSCWTKNLVSFTSDITLNTFTCIFFSLFGIHARVIWSSIVLQLSPHLLRLKVKG